jgi:hypothetical protein
MSNEIEKHELFGMGGFVAGLLFALILATCSGCNIEVQLSCDIEPIGGGCFHATCDDGTDLTLCNGQDGEPGADGADGAQGEPGADGQAAIFTSSPYETDNPPGGCWVVPPGPGYLYAIKTLYLCQDQHEVCFEYTETGGETPQQGTITKVDSDNYRFEQHPELSSGYSRCLAEWEVVL